MAGKKITMSLSEKTLQMLEDLSNQKGVKKSAIVAFAVEKYYSSDQKIIKREEQCDKK